MERIERTRGGLHRLAPSGLVLLVLMLANGCATIAEPVVQQPFESYQSAVAELKQQTDQALKQVADAELAQFRQQAADDPATVLQLMLEFPPDQPFGWCYTGREQPVSGDIPAVPSSEDLSGNRAALDSAVAAAGACQSKNLPLFAKLEQMQSTMVAINGQLLQYAGLLVALAGADEASRFDPAEQAERFDQAASGLLGRLAGLGVNAGAPVGNGLALFSTLAANAAGRYLESKRREHLVEVLVAGKAPLTRLVELSRQALEIAATSVTDQYQEQARTRFRAAIGGSATLDDVMAFNQQLQDRLNLLKTISGGYGALLNAHGQLISSLNQDRPAGLGELLAYARDIKDQYEAIKAAQPGSEPGESP